MIATVYTQTKKRFKTGTSNCRVQLRTLLRFHCSFTKLHIYVSISLYIYTHLASKVMHNVWQRCAMYDSSFKAFGLHYIPGDSSKHKKIDIMPKSGVQKLFFSGWHKGVKKKLSCFCSVLQLKFQKVRREERKDEGQILMHLTISEDALNGFFLHLHRYCSLHRS